jgi:hypothetical protein
MDGTTFRVYRNGVQVSSGAVTTAPLSTAGYKLYINELPVVSGSSGLTCSMQNVRLWSRALLDSEVFELYINPWAGLSVTSSTSYFFVPQLITASPKLFSVSGSSVSMRSNAGRVSVRAAR